MSNGGWFLGIGDIHGGIISEEDRDLLLLLDKSVPSEGTDRLVWDDGSDIFTVRQCYTRILDLRLRFFNNGIHRYDWSRVWISVLPSKCCFLVWLIIRDKLLTQRNLQKRGFSLPSRCELCYTEIEDTDHLFCTCEVSSSLWRYF